MDKVQDKNIVWIKSSFANLCSLPEITRHQAGFQLRRVQQGKMPEDWKPMPAIGPGVIEIRLHHPNEYRLIYVAKFADNIYVLHAFEKKTQKTPQRDLTITRTAYAEIKRPQKNN